MVGLLACVTPRELITMCRKPQARRVTSSSPMLVTVTVGRTGMGTVQFLHGQDETKIPGARKIIDKIYVGGGVLDAQELVARGLAEPNQFRFFLQLCGWAPGQLQAEASQLHMVLQQYRMLLWYSVQRQAPSLCCCKHAKQSSPVHPGLSWLTANATSPEVILKPCINLDVPLWREVLQLMGNKYSLISRGTYNDL
eukprot:20529-Heterococcus_DN1.PRE.3